jgi:hypothetical protein
MENENVQYSMFNEHCALRRNGSALVHQPFHQGVAGAAGIERLKAFAGNYLQQVLTLVHQHQEYEGWCTKHVET